PIIASSVARVARKFGRSSPDLILDLTQDVYFKLCRDGFKLLRDLRITYEKALFAYLKLVAMSAAHDYFRKKRPDVGGDAFTDDTFRGSTGLCVTKESTEEERILVLEIEAIVERITGGPNGERDRSVFWLHHREGFTASAIAAIPALKLTQKGVESVLHRIKTSLREELRQSRKDDRFPQRVKADFSVS
ncbi:MAG TPA: sigma-70 family RNA polymerase sigma factor, partial [Candidatus Angelobacter sp.]